MIRPGKKCTRPGCQRRHYAKGLCRMHYERKAHGWDMDAPARTQDGTPRDLDFCSVEGCYRARHCAGLCAGHYRRKLRGGDVTKPLGSTTNKAGDPTIRLCFKPWVDVWVKQAIDDEALRSGRSIPEVLREAVTSWAERRGQVAPVSASR